MVIWLTLLAVLVAIASAIGGMFSLITDIWLADGERANARLAREFRNQQVEKTPSSPLFKNFHNLVKQSSPGGNSLRNWKLIIKHWLEGSGVGLTLRGLLNWMIGLALLLGMAIGIWRQSWLMGLLGGAFDMIILPLYIYRRRETRRERLLFQLAEAFETIARVLRAGQTLMQSLTVVANECESPICDEFSFCFEEQKLGLPAHVAFQEMSERVGILEMHLFTLASRVQQRTGGNMAALVEKLAEMVRQRFRMRQKIKALTAEGRLQATVLLGLPPVILGVMVIVKWDYVEALFRHPELIAITLGLQLLGFLWIRHIIRFDR